MPVYYVVREALTNVHKYARADRVEVDVETDGRVVRIVVTDDGVGGAVPRVGGGMDGMRERPEELGGSLELESTPGAGTTARAVIPRV